MNDAIQSCGRLGGFFERAIELEEAAPTPRNFGPQSDKAGVDAHAPHGARTRASALPVNPQSSSPLPLARFTASLLRMRVGPAVAAAGWTDEPLHVALFGGTNTGKSTLVNLLLGRAAAGMDVRARFSQYPEAYPPAGLGEEWLRRGAARFERYRIHLNERPPRYSDEELAGGAYVAALAVFTPPAAPAAPGPVLWDLPDFSTEQARAYLPAVLDLAALADLLIMTVTGESYADARGMALLGLLREAGGRLMVVGNRAAGSRDLEDDIRQKIGAIAPEAEVFFLPYVEAESAAERLRLLGATPEAAALREAVAGSLRERDALKRQALAGAAGFMERHLGEVLGPLEEEARHARDWQDFVREATRTQLLGRYNDQYLETEEYGEFRQTLLRVMEQLEIPGISALVRGVGEVIRTPLRLVRGWLTGPQTPRPPAEEKVLLALFESWLAALREYAQHRAQKDRGAAWVDLAVLLASEAETRRLREGLTEQYEKYRQALQEEIGRRTREIVEIINRNPALKNTLKGLRLGTNVLSTSLAIASHGLDPTDFVLAPAVSAMTDWLWDALGRYYVEDQRRRLKQYQLESMRRLVSEALGDPAAGLIRARVTQQDMTTAWDDFERVKQTVGRILEETK